MTWHIAIYAGLLQLAVASLLLLAIASTAVAIIRQPARRIRIIELTLAALLILPWLTFVPGYPRWSILPAVGPFASPRAELAASEPIQSPAVCATPDAVLSDATVSKVAVSNVTLPEVAVSQVAMPEVAVPDVGPQVSANVATPIPAPAEVPRASNRGWHLDSPTDFRWWVVVAYLTGVCGFVFWSLVGAIALVRLLRSTREADRWCRELLREIGGPTSDRFALLVSARVSQPCALAWWPTTIVLPESMCAAGNSQQLRWALGHEWSHIERADVWSWSLSSVVRWFYFYQPLAWWLRRQLRLCQDFVADAAAARTGAMPEDYAEFLTAHASRLSNPPLAAGLGIGGRASDLHRRIVMLVENHHPLETASPRRWNLAVLPITIVLLAAAACLREKPASVAAESEQRAALVEPAQAAAPAERATPALPAEKAIPAPPADPAVAPAERAAPAEPKPRLIKPGDVLSINVVSNYDNSQPVGLLFPSGVAETVDADGMLSLGGHYDLLHVAGMSLHSAERGIADELRDKLEMDIKSVQAHDKNFVRSPIPIQINVRLAGGQQTPFFSPPKMAAAPQTPKRIVPGDILHLDIPDMAEELSGAGIRRDWVFVVEPDGNIALGAHYGRANVLGKTLIEAEEVIKKHLSKEFNDPLVQVTYQRLDLVDASRVRELEREIAELKAMIRRSKK